MGEVLDILVAPAKCVKEHIPSACIAPVLPQVTALTMQSVPNMKAATGQNHEQVSPATGSMKPNPLVFSLCEWQTTPVFCISACVSLFTFGKTGEERIFFFLSSTLHAQASPLTDGQGGCLLV